MEDPIQPILVAEDDAGIRELLVEVLGDLAGWLVMAFEDGANLLAALATVPPALVVLDVNMPGISGIEVYRKLRRRPETGEVPVLFVTAYPDAVTQAHLPGPHTMLVKPFAVDRLLAQVGALLGRPIPEA